MRELVNSKDKIFEKFIEEGVITREELVESVTKHNELMAQTVPWNGGARLRPINSTKPNHAVGEVYKAGKFIDLRRDLNIHDPENQYRWQDENGGWFIWTMRALGALGFIVGIYSLVFLGMLL